MALQAITTTITTVDLPIKLVDVVSPMDLDTTPAAAAPQPLEQDPEPLPNPPAEISTAPETTEDHLLRQSQEYARLAFGHEAPLYLHPLTPYHPHLISLVTYSYQVVSRALNVLKYQLEQASKDVETLKIMKDRAMSDPFEFVRQLKTRTNEKAPSLQRIVAVPEIEWSKYQNPPAGRIARQLAALNVDANFRYAPYKRSAFKPTLLHNAPYRTPSTTIRQPKPTSRPHSRHTSPNPTNLSLSAQISIAAQSLLGPLPPSSSSSASASVRAQSTDPSDIESDDEPDGAIVRVASGKGKGTMVRAVIASSPMVATHAPAPLMTAPEVAANKIKESEISLPALLKDSSGQKCLESIASTSSEATVPAASVPVNPGKVSPPSSSPPSSKNRAKNAKSSMMPPPSKEKKEKPKPENYNILWSDEEQRHLEELLQIYPDEPVQAQRFHKISVAMGTRTPRQVASRVQKYFIKLAKNGLPVPGRFSIPPSCLPKSQRPVSGTLTKTTGEGTPKPSTTSSHNSSSKPKSKKNRSSLSHPHTKPSNGIVSALGSPAVRTSGLGYNASVSGGITNTRISGTRYLLHAPPTVLMSDDDDDDDIKEAMMGVDAWQQAVGHLQPVQLMQGHVGGMDEAQEEMIRLKKLAKQQSREHQEYSEGVDDVLHLGYSCNSCNIEPITGIRYKCAECDVNQEVDLCEGCMLQGGFQNDHHPLTHRFEEISKAEALPYYADNDYTEDYMDEYSYLGFGATA